jgi:hypothetical protein
MKKKKVLEALKLNKTTVANLNNLEMHALHGGDDTDPTEPSGYTVCFTKCMTNCDLCRTDQLCGFTKYPHCH